MAGEAYAFSEGYAGIGAVPDSRFGFFGVHYTRTPKERANVLAKPLCAHEKQDEERVLATDRFAAHSLGEGTAGSG